VPFGIDAPELVDDVVGVERDELHGPDLEGVEVAAQPVAVVVDDAVVRQQEPAQVVAETVRAVEVVAGRALRPDAAGRGAGHAGLVVDAELALVVTERGHPRPVRRRAADVVAEVAPHAWRVEVVQVGVAQVAVEQVEQWRPLAIAGVLDGADGVVGVVAGLVPDVARDVQIPRRRRQVTEAREPELGPAARRGLEARPRRGRTGRAVTDLVVVPRSGLETPELHVVEVRRLAVQPVGEADRARARTGLGHVQRRRRGQPDGAARIARGYRRRRVGQGRRGLRNSAGR
jgi:hypothetical protein